MKTTLSLLPRRPLTRIRATVMTGIALLLGACASAPPPPDWQASAFAALNSYTSAYLEGNTRVADFEFARAKSEIARTGRLDLMAKIELVHCATQVASLVLEPCTGYQALATDALPPERNYAAFITGLWSDINTEQLPTQYRTLVKQALENTARSAAATPSIPPPPGNSLGQIQDPLSRLIAAGALLKSERITPVDIGLAVDTASSQGWRRPLLAWLGVQQKRAQAAGDTATAASLQRRMDLVLQVPTRPGKAD
jgi:hypothetical protein